LIPAQSETTSVISFLFSPLPNAASKSTRWIQLAPEAIHSEAMSIGEPNDSWDFSLPGRTERPLDTSIAGSSSNEESSGVPAAPVSWWIELLAWLLTF
jgi:hypothetical protein